MRFFNELKDAVMNEDFFETNQVLEKIKQEDNSFEYLPPIFELMEEKPDLDYGMPGPIVHFMEGYYKRGYEDLLLRSVQKFPTSHTIWMLNRVINDPKLIDRDGYIEILKTLLERKDISEFVRSDIKKCLEYQQNVSK